MTLSSLILFAAVYFAAVATPGPGVAALIAAGELEVPIAATFPLDRVQDAYRRLAEGHLLGKIVLLP